VFQFASKPSVHCQFFKAFEITGTDSSLIPNLFQRTRTDSPLILQQLKDWNQQFFINSNNQWLYNLMNVSCRKSVTSHLLHIKYMGASSAQHQHFLHGQTKHACANSGGRLHTSEYTDRRGVSKCTVMCYSKCAKLDCLSEED
jgi:hypothetical protein